VIGWRLAVVEDHASRRRVGAGHDGGRGQRAVLDVARQLLEVDQRRDRLRLRTGVEQARRGGRADAQQLESVEQQTANLARRAQRADDVADLDLKPLLGARARSGLEPFLRVRGQVRGAQRASARANHDPRRLIQNGGQDLQSAELVRPASAAARQHHPNRPVHRPTLSRPHLAPARRPIRIDGSSTSRPRALRREAHVARVLNGVLDPASARTGCWRSARRSRPSR
jgi:hypothetical protein